MNILLGNLSVEDIEKRLGVNFTEEIKTFLNSTRQQRAENIEDGKWHCFDMPFTIVCGTKKFVEENAKVIEKKIKKEKTVKEIKDVIKN